METKEIIKKIVNACHPNQAAIGEGYDYYTDCRVARGGELLADNVINKLENFEDDFLRLLFTGHIGSGKTSELLHLCELLKNAKSGKSFLPIYINIKDYVNLEKNLTFDDILLAIAVAIVDSFREIGIKLKKGYLKNKFDRIVKSLTAERSLSDIEVNIGVLKADIQKINDNNEAREILFKAIADEKTSLLEELNLFISGANLALKNDGRYLGIVLIVDTLEKVEKFDNADKGLPSQHQIFIENYSNLTGVNAHTIYTCSLALYSSKFGGKLTSYYGDVLMLPMVKIFHRGRYNDEFDAGCAAIKKLLEQRFGDIKLTEVFDADALSSLIKYSGGNLRSLMQYIQNAVLNAEKLPIPIKEARKSIKNTVRIFAKSIDESYWDKLVKLELSDKQQIDNGDPAFWEMLENLTIMEYVNGDDTESVDDTWYAVNPVIREIGKFQAALARIK